MSTMIAPAPNPATSATIDQLPALPRLVARLPDRALEHLVLFGPPLLLPLAGTAADWLRLGLVYAILVALEGALAGGRARLPRRSATLVLGSGLTLAVVLLLGSGPLLALALIIALRCLEQRTPPTAWPYRLALAALATAVVVDLAVIVLALERSFAWLALGAAIGAGLAANRLRRRVEGEPAPAGRRGRSLAALEAALIGALVAILALYAALLAGEPAFIAAAAGGGYLTLPLLAMALLRLACVALDGSPRPGVDPWAVLLLAAWATAALQLLGQP